MEPAPIRRYDRTADRREGRRRRRCAQRVAAEVAAVPRRDRPRRPASPPCWSARTRRAPSMSAPRARRPPKPGWRASRTSFRRHVSEAELLDLVDRAQRRRRGRRHPRPAAAAAADRRRHGSSPRSTRTRTSTASTRSMPAGWRPGSTRFVPCTPLGCLHAAASTSSATSPGKDAVVIGRSNIVGKPMALLLLGESATVTIAHSRTRDLPDVVRRADIVVAAVGRPEMVRGDWIKPGATVIDVGINRVADRGRQGPAGRRRRLRRGEPRSPARSRRCPAASGR